jgi:hypothetical protein
MMGPFHAAFGLAGMPSDVAIAVSNHLAVAHGGRLGFLFEWLKMGRLG